MEKTKTICTMGPNTSDKNVVMELAENGMDVARFNFSYDDYNEHQRRLELLKEVRKELDIPITALLDTKGPGIRTGQLKDGKKVTLEEGQTYTLTTRELVRDDTVGYINYSGLSEDVAADNRILVGDGLIELGVCEVKDTDIVCEIANGGEPGEKEGVNIPSVKTKLPVLMDKDKKDIRSGIGQGFDFIAASFVHTADCIKEIKAILDGQDSGMKITAKIENAGGIENLGVITEAVDGVMMARGNMDAEIPAEKVPYIQKKIIRKCNEACKIATTATQMLDSMIRNPRSARAEMTGAASAAYDGTGAVVLSGETAMGKYPVDAFKMMVSIALETKMHLNYMGYRQKKVTEQNMKNISSAVCFASVSTTHNLDADVIIAPSITGFITQMLSRWRPGARITSMPPSMVTVRQMQFQWGVVSVWSRRVESMGKLTENSVEELKDRGLVEEGELAVVTAGVVTCARRHKAAIQTNIMRVISIG